MMCFVIYRSSLMEKAFLSYEIISLLKVNAQVLLTFRIHFLVLDGINSKVCSVVFDFVLKMS